MSLSAVVCINRNIVECKYNCAYCTMKISYCINRNIVECKSHKLSFPPLKEKSINRNIVECKYRLTRRGTSVNRVLIETLWNVNDGIDEETPFA